VRNLTGRLAQGSGALRLEGAHPTTSQLGGHLAHAIPQHHELRRALARRHVGHGLAAPDGVSPPHELIQGATQVPAEVVGHTRCDEREQQRGDDRDARSHHRHFARHQELHLPGVQEAVLERGLMLVERSALIGVQRRTPRCSQGFRTAGGDLLHRRDGAKYREQAHDGELPRRRKDDRRNERKTDEEQKKTSAKSDLLHGPPYERARAMLRGNIQVVSHPNHPLDRMRTATTCRTFPHRTAGGDQRETPTMSRAVATPTCPSPPSLPRLRAWSFREARAGSPRRQG
jgi:hypothetical protein